MSDNDTSTPNDGTQDAAASASVDANDNASTSGSDEVSVLKSRYAGQTAKVNELTGQTKAQSDRIKELEEQLKAAREGTASKDDVAQALLKAKDEELAAIRKEAALARIEAKYPETFSELGEDAATLSEEKLAAMEARFRGVESEAPKPRGNNAPRTDSAPAKPKEETADDIVARLKTQGLPQEWGG